MALTKVTGHVIKSDTNITSHNINSSGIITAISFDGNVSGVAVTFTGDSTIGSLGITTNLNVGGISTFTGNIDANGDLDVDGHTNLDNVSIAGVTTSQTINFGTNKRANFATNNRFSIHSNGTNSYLDYAGSLNVRGNSGSAAALSFQSNSNVLVTNDLTVSGNSTVSGNLSVGGVLTYQDVTNIDSIGIITARSNIDCNGSLDVDGHTDLDNVSISGITTITSAAPELHLTDTNANSDYSIVVNGGQFRVRDETNSANRLAVNSDGHVDIYGRLDAVGGFVASSNSAIEGNLELTSTYPSLTWTDTNHNSDFRITNDDGKLIVYDITRGAHVMDFLASGDVRIRNDKGLTFGEGNDLAIAHDGSLSRLSDTYGHLKISSNLIEITNQSLGENYIKCTNNAAVDLYYDNAVKLTTSATGITVTGEVAASQDYPNFRPTLDLNFAAQKKLDPRITYQRTGPASFVNEFGKVVLVGDNAPRFDHDPDTGECKGLLIEESRTNIIYPSSDWSSANYTHENNNTSQEPNTTDTEDPAGTFNATKITPEQGVSTLRSIYWGTNITFTNTVKFTMSAFAKSTTGLHVQLRPRGQGSGKAWATFNLTTGVVGNSGGSVLVSTKIEKYPNDWYRCSLTFTGGGHTAGGFGALIMDDGNDGEAGTHTGDASKSIFFWGAQFETGSFATSYIPTSPAAVTRGADIVLLDDIENEIGYNQLEGTVITDFSYTQDSDGGQTIFSFSGTESNPADQSYRSWLRINQSAGTANAVRIYQNGNYNDSSSTATPGVFQKVAYAYSSTDQDVSLDGSSVTDASRTPPTNLFRLGLGNIGWSLGLETTSLEGHIKRFMYYPKKLSNSQLNTLTS